MMEFRHLVSFLALADELHFSRAAAKIHITQPSLSLQLQRLEQSVGVRLVARTSHQVALTPAGSMFLGEARRILAEVEHAKVAARSVAAGRAGSIRVGYNVPAGQSVLPATLARIYTDSPDIQVTLHEMRSGPQLRAVLAGELDLAIVCGRPPMAQLASERLHPVRLVALVGTGHQLAGRRRIRFAELARQPCILFRREQSPTMYDTVMAGASQAGITLDVVEHVDDPSAIVVMAASRPVVGFTSAARARQSRATPGGAHTVAVPLVDPVPMLDLHVAWRATDAGPLIQAFRELLRTAAERIEGRQDPAPPADRARHPRPAGAVHQPPTIPGGRRPAEGRRPAALPS